MNEHEERQVKIGGGIAAAGIITIVIVSFVVIGTNINNQPTYMNGKQANAFIDENWKPYFENDGSHVIGNYQHYFTGSDPRFQISNASMFELLYDSAAQMINNTTWINIGLSRNSVLIFVNANYTIHSELTDGFVIFCVVSYGMTYILAFDFQSLNMAAATSFNYTIKKI